MGAEAVTNVEAHKVAFVSEAPFLQMAKYTRWSKRRHMSPPPKGKPFDSYCLLW